MARYALKKKLFEVQEGKCWICGEPMVFRARANNPRGASFDHIKPKSHGGLWEESNLKLAHRECNIRRGNGSTPFSNAWLRRKGYL